MEEQRSSKNAVVIEAGDAFFPPAKRDNFSADESDSRAAFVRDVYASLALDAFVPGELDLKGDLDAAMENLKSLKSPVIAANLVDAADGKPIFPPSVVVERNGLRLLLIGALGMTPFKGSPANADFDLAAWRSEQKYIRGAGKRREMSDVSKLLAEAGRDGDDNRKAELNELLKELQADMTAEGEEPLPPPDYAGRRFRVTDAAEAVNRELDARKGRFDISIVIGHMEAPEVEAFRKAVPRAHFFVDGHGETKSVYARSDGQAPHVIRSGSRGRMHSVVEVTMLDGKPVFEDLGDREKARTGLERQKSLWDRFVKDAGGKDPLTAFPPEDRRYKRAERTAKQMKEFEEVLARKPAGGAIEVRTVNMGTEIAADPALKAREDEIAPPAKRGH